MKKTTLCYIEKDGQYLMLFRNKKQQDPNEGKWIGIGGKLEPGETPDQCVVREVKEETGLDLVRFQSRGVVYFHSDVWEDETMYLYTADQFTGELAADCNEGELQWIPISSVLDLPSWEGDRIFLKKMLSSPDPINLSLYYEGEHLIRTASREEA